LSNIDCKLIKYFLHLQKIASMIFQQNLKLLRERLKISQEKLSAELSMTRSALNNYENGFAEPNMATLLKISDYFKIPTDVLLKKNLSKLSEKALADIKEGGALDITGSKLRVLTTVVNEKQKENIELVPVKAKAGYLNGYADPEYIKELPRFYLPFLDSAKKYRGFQIDGDSMPPVPDKGYFIGEYVQNWEDVKNGRPYLFLVKDEAAIFKIAFNKVKKEKHFLLCSTNTFYEPLKVDVRNVLEIWKFTAFISHEFPYSGNLLN
jgi:transcriptional regulator with XRE-family HTH domain